MHEKPARWIPLLSAAIDFAIVAGVLLLWHPQERSFWWYVRAVPFGIFSFHGCRSLWHTFVSSDEQLNRQIHGSDSDQISN